MGRIIADHVQDILRLSTSHRGSVRALAERIARSIAWCPAPRPACARFRELALCEATAATVPDAGAPYVEAIDLDECIGLALGSPVRFRQHGGADEILGQHRRRCRLAESARWPASRPVSSRLAAASMVATNRRCSR